MSMTPTDKVMLILPGVARTARGRLHDPNGLLDRKSALDYAQFLGYSGEVLEVSGETGAESRQTKAALKRIQKGDVKALYGFSGGGYNARWIWQALTSNSPLRGAIETVVVIGSPGITKSQFFGCNAILIKKDPPEGHMAGPKVLLRDKVRPVPTYHSKIPGAYFSANPYDKSVRASQRTNNPGAVNGAEWEKSLPGYVTTINLDGVNHATIFASPEEGIAAWFILMKRYRDIPRAPLFPKGARTPRQIVLRYGGGQANYATQYVPFVAKHSGLDVDKELDLNDNNAVMKLAKAMFLMEVGTDRKFPWSDEQIRHGIRLGRNYKAGMPIEQKATAGTATLGTGAAAAAGTAWGLWAAIGVIALTVVIVVFIYILYKKRNEPQLPTTPPLPPQEKQPPELQAPVEVK